MLSLSKISLTPDDCKKIISRGQLLIKLFESWHVSNNTYGDINIKRMFIGHYIQGILKNTSIPKTPSVELLKYNEGSSAKVHIDVSGPYRSSFMRTENVAWQQTGILILNNDFEGGELFFPELNIRYGKESAGDLIVFPAGESKFAHGVTTVTSGTRYSLVFRFC
jgi:hypothetical protein